MAGQDSRLPSFLQSSYKQYKDDTRKIATWLSNLAQRCGYPAESLTSTQSKSRAQHLISIRDFKNLAEYIASKATQRIPDAFVSVLDRVITVRKRHREYWRHLKINAVDGIHQKDGHEYFIGVLESVREVLEPLFEKAAPASLETARVVESDANHHVRNLFAGLEIYDTDENVELPSTERASEEESQNSKRRPPDGQHDLEMDGWDDLVFAAHLLFSDLHALRNYIHEMWYDYREEKIDLIVAAVTTNSALDFARRVGEEFATDFPQISMSNLQMAFYNAEYESRGLDPEGGRNFEAHDTAVWVFLPMQILLSSFQDVLSQDSRTVPAYKSGHFGHYDPETDPADISAEEIFDNQLVLTAELLQDFAFITRSKSSIPIEDEFTRGFRQLSKKGPISLGFMFAYQIFLDIQQAYGSKDNTLWGLQQSGRKIHSSIKQHFKFHENLQNDDWDPRNDAVMRALLSDIERWVMSDTIDDGINEPLQEHGLPPRSGHFHLLSKHPILCGLMAFNIHLRACEIGINIVNAWGSILYCGHLYNALRQERNLHQEWSDMEFIFKTQNKSTIFGGEPPTSFEDYLKRFQLAMGTSAQDVLAGPGRRPARKLRASAKGPRCLSEEEPIPICTFFAQRYCHGAKSIELTPTTVQMIVEKTPTFLVDYIQSGAEKGQPFDPSRQPQSPKKASKRTKSARTKNENSNSIMKMSPIQLLDCLYLALNAEMDALKFDYLMLHRLCWRLLRKVQADCHNQLIEYPGPGYLEKESMLPWTVGYIFLTAVGSSRAADHLKLPKAKVETASRIFQTAADSVNGFLDAGAGKQVLFVLRKDTDYLAGRSGEE